MLANADCAYISLVMDDTGQIIERIYGNDLTSKLRPLGRLTGLSDMDEPAASKPMLSWFARDRLTADSIVSLPDARAHFPPKPRSSWATNSWLGFAARRLGAQTQPSWGGPSTTHAHTTTSSRPNGFWSRGRGPAAAGALGLLAAALLLIG